MIPDKSDGRDNSRYPRSTVSPDRLLQQLEQGQIDFSHFVEDRINQLQSDCHSLVEAAVDRDNRMLQLLLSFYRGDRRWLGLNDGATLAKIALILKVNPTQLEKAYQSGHKLFASPRHKWQGRPSKSTQSSMPRRRDKRVPTTEERIKANYPHLSALELRQFRLQLNATQGMVAKKAKTSVPSVGAAESQRASQKVVQKVTAGLILLYRELDQPLPPELAKVENLVDVPSTTTQ